MANVHGLGDYNKKSGGGGGGGGAGRGNPPPGGDGGGFLGGLGGMFGGLGGGGGGHQDSKNIKHLQEGQLRSELQKAGGKLVVIDFTASWCGPCKMIAPYFSELADKYTDVVFLKIDVDECRDTAQQCGIKAMPTFQFYKNGSKVDEFSGASPDKLRETIEKHRGGSSSAPSSTGGGYVLGTASNPPANLADRFSQPGNSAQPPATSSSGTQANSGVSGSGSGVNEVLLNQLVDMGFSKEQAERGLRATGDSSVEAAMDWCINHPAEGGHALGGTTSQSTSTIPAPTPTISTPPVTTPTQTPPVLTQPTSTATSSEPVTTETPQPMETELSPDQANPELNQPTVHNAICNNCMKRIVGTRWKCEDCSDYDLCQECYPKRMEISNHKKTHTFDEHIEDIENPQRKALTKDEIEERKKKLQDRIQKKKEDKAVEEKQDEINREKIRRQSGKDAIEAKKQWEAKQRERDALAKQKEKEDDRRAQQKIRDKIEQDKKERAAQKAKEATAAESQSQQSQPTPQPQQQQQAPSVQKEYTDCAIQVRLPDTTLVKANFKPTDPVRSVHQHISLLTGNNNFSLRTQFPTKVYSPKDSSLDTTTLQQAGCVPNGTFIATKL